MNLISKQKKTAVVELSDVKETVIQPLIDRLLDEKDVVLAAYKTGHPQLDKPRLTVKTDKLKPETAIKKAADNLVDDIRTFQKEFEKGVKSYKAKKERGKKKKTKEKEAKEKPKKAKPKPKKAKAKPSASKTAKKKGKGKTKKKSK
jgi:DNA-directed RNA polymerase subunit L